VAGVGQVRANARLAERLDAAGFDAAMKAALAAEPVLCADETPVNLWHKDRGADGAALADGHDWHGGNRPGHKLARRLADKADQVWLFTKNLAVSWRNNPAEQALRGPKRHQAVSGYWHRPARAPPAASARDHGIRALDAIHHALAGRPWLPIPVATTA
jgi:hypothetical protein